jgi:elongation factor 1-beta
MSLKEINGKLTSAPYVAGYTPSKEDAALFKQLFGDNQAVIQWAARMASYYQSERDQLVSGPKKPEAAKPAAAAATSAPKAAAKPAAKEEEEFDMFGEETDEEQQARMAKKLADIEAKKGKKEKAAVIAKSSILLDVKTWDDTVDLEALALKIKSNVRDGLMWGAHKQAPVAFGVKKLQLLFVIEDDKVSSEDIEELIMQYEEEVQSMDVVAWNKV